MTAFTSCWPAGVLTDEALLYLDDASLSGPTHENPEELRRVARRARHRRLPASYGWEELRSRFEQIRAHRRADVAVCFRHGMTNYNRRNLISGQHDTLLTPAGVQQAEAISDALPRHLDLIVCSALTRTIQTMMVGVPEHVRHSTPVVVDPRLNEVNLGQLQGRRRAFVQAFSDGDIDYAPPGGESYRSAAQRIFSSVSDIFFALAVAGGPPRHVAIFCHAGVLRILSSLAGSNMDGSAVFHLDVRNAESVTLTSQTLQLSPVWLSEEHNGGYGRPAYPRQRRRR